MRPALVRAVFWCPGNLVLDHACIDVARCAVQGSPVDPPGHWTSFHVADTCPRPPTQVLENLSCNPALHRDMAHHPRLLPFLLRHVLPGAAAGEQQQHKRARTMPMQANAAKVGAEQDVAACACIVVCGDGRECHGCACTRSSEGSEQRPLA